jgi:hypothetical protein
MSEGPEDINTPKPIKRAEKPAGQGLRKTDRLYTAMWTRDAFSADKAVPVLKIAEQVDPGLISTIAGHTAIDQDNLHKLWGQLENLLRRTKSPYTVRTQLERRESGRTIIRGFYLSRLHEPSSSEE